MNNKGFIATSLIYSFFLIFITLFLTIIADYLQNKVLLNAIEDEIKDNINYTKSIEDFEIGDILFFNTNYGSIPIGTTWVISNIDHKEKDLILYSMDPNQGNVTCTDESCVTIERIEQDLAISGDNNFTRILEILNAFSYKDGASNYNYKINTPEGEKIIKKDCVQVEDDSLKYDNCPTTGNFVKSYRKRIKVDVSTIKFQIEPNETTGITIKGVL